MMEPGVVERTRSVLRKFPEVWDLESRAPRIISAIMAIGVITSAVQTGYGIYNTVTQGDSQAPTPAKPTPTPQPTATNQAQTAAVTQQLPNLQALTGGSLSPEYAAQYGATTTGLGSNPQASGNIQEAINQFFGLTAPGQSGLTPQSTSAPGGTSIVDLLSRGTVPGMTSTGVGSGVTDKILSDEFHGFALQ